MTDKQFATVWGDALVAHDRSEYVSNWALSSLFPPPDSADDINPELVDQLSRIWDVAHMTAGELRAVTGLSQVAFAARYCIPRRTVENWESRPGSCPDYVRLMLAQLLGVLKR